MSNGCRQARNEAVEGSMLVVVSCTGTESFSTKTSGFSLFSFPVAGIELGALYLLGKCSTAELYRQSH